MAFKLPDPRGFLCNIFAAEFFCNASEGLSRPHRQGQTAKPGCLLQSTRALPLKKRIKMKRTVSCKFYVTVNLLTNPTSNITFVLNLRPAGLLFEKIEERSATYSADRSRNWRIE
jgi:hypothetical protein